MLIGYSSQAVDGGGGPELPLYRRSLPGSMAMEPRIKIEERSGKNEAVVVHWESA